MLAGLQKLTFQKRDRLVRCPWYRPGRADANALQHKPATPDRRRCACMHLTGMWQPPMLDVALDELSGCRAQQMLARYGQVAWRQMPLMPSCNWSRKA